MKLGKMGIIAAALGMFGMGAMHELNNNATGQQVSKKNAKSNRNNQKETPQRAQMSDLDEFQIKNHHRGGPVVYNFGGYGPKEWGMYLQSNHKQKWTKKRKS